MNIKETSEAIHANNVAKGFWEEGLHKNKGEALMLVVTELSEALEADRKGFYSNYVGRFPEDHEHYLQESESWFRGSIKDTFEDEIADAVIRLLDLSQGFNIDIEWHIARKMALNACRPYKHGKAY